MLLIILETHCSVHSNKIYTVKHKNTPKFINHINLKADHQILIIRGTTIPDTTCHQTIIQVFTSPKICFFTTWENQNT